MVAASLPQMDEPIGTLVRDVESKINSLIQEAGEKFVPEVIHIAAQLSADIIKELKTLKEMQAGLDTANCQIDLLIVLTLYLADRNKKLTEAVMIGTTDLMQVWKSIQQKLTQIQGLRPE